MPEYTPEQRAELDAVMAKALKTRDACRYYSMSSFKDTPEADDVLNLAMWAVPLLTAHIDALEARIEQQGDELSAMAAAASNARKTIDAQAERIAELERDNARLRKGLQSVKIQDTRNEYQTYLNYAEDREYSTKVEVEGPCAKIARAALAKARA